MKRLISLLLSVILCFSVLAIPSASVIAASSKVSTKVSGLQITTANKQKLLKLKWKTQSQADGYQIYRSTTGKSGTFKKIATVRNKTSYIDKNLKNAKTYYYKVRSFVKNNGKIKFGTFAKTNLSTKITPAYAKKKINSTMKFLHNFYTTGTNFDKMILRSHTNEYGTSNDPHYLFQYKGCKTKAQLKKYLTKYVSSKVANYILKEKFYIINGKLYIWFPPLGAESAMILSKTKVSNWWYSDRKATMRIATFWYGEAVDENGSYYNFNQTLIYENGRWVFGQLNYMTDWIYPYY